jgi:hypothetical protein
MTVITGNNNNNNNNYNYNNYKNLTKQMSAKIKDSIFVIAMTFSENNVSRIFKILDIKVKQNLTLLIQQKLKLKLDSNCGKPLNL